MRWMAPELLCPADDSKGNPTMQSDVYSFGSIMLQVRHLRVYLCFSTVCTYWHHGKILTGSTPYHYLRRNEQVVLAVALGTRPKRPAEAAVTDRRWEFMEWCWSPVDTPRPRPCSDEIIEFTGKELAEIMAVEV